MVKGFRQYGYQLLKRIEDYAQTDMIYLTRGSFWLGVGKGIGIVSGLILSVAFANLLPKDAFGTYQFVLSLAAVVSAFTLTGLKTAILQAVSRGYEGALWRGFITYLKWSIGIALGGFTLAFYYFVNDNNTLAVSFLIIGALAPFLESFKLYPQFFAGKKDFRLVTLFETCHKPLPITAILLTLFLTNNPVIIVFVYFLSHTVTAGVLFWYMLEKYKPGDTIEHGSMLNYAKHLSFLNILGSIADNLDRILLFHFVGPAQVAIYSFARMPQSYLSNITGIIKTLLFPKMSTQSMGTLKKTLPRKLFLLLLVLLGIVIVYIFTAPLIFRFLFPQYLDSVLFSQVLALIILFSPLGMVRLIFYAHARKKEMYTLSVGGQVLKIALLLVLLPLYGIWGAIIALFATRAIIGIAGVYFFVTAK